MDGFLVALLVGLFGGLANLLVDIPALWNHDWSRGFPGYRNLLETKHRHLHTPVFARADGKRGHREKGRILNYNWVSGRFIENQGF